MKRIECISCFMMLLIVCIDMQGTTVIDKIIPYAWRDENGGACYNEMYFQDDNILFARVDPFPLNNEESTLLFYQKRTVGTNKELKNYSIYKQTIKK